MREVQDPALRELALTHASFDGERNNERLEFLGDTVLDLVVAEELYRRSPGASEGAMSRAKAWLVSRKTLAQAAKRLDLAARARLGKSLEHQAVPTSIHANLFEAWIGALHLDAGLDAAAAFVHAALAPELTQAVDDGVARNHKQRLQEWAQARGDAPPDYHTLEEQGSFERSAFRVQAEIAGRRFPAAWGRTRKEAEQHAAREALSALEGEGALG